MTDTPPPSTIQRPAASRHPLAPLFNTGTVSLRCAQVLQSVRNNLSAHFRVDPDALQRLAEQVQQTFQPQAEPPLQQVSRAGLPAQGAPWSGENAAVAAAPFWQHLQAGGTNRLAEFSGLLAGQAPADQARAWADLAIIGVLMSADPGPRWRCTEQHTLPTAAFAQAQADDLLALLDRAGKTALPQAQTAGAATPQAAASGNPGDTDPPVAKSASASASASASESASEPTKQPAPVAAPVAEPVAVPVSAPVTAPAATTPSPSAARFAGAEGLAIATFRAFVAGAFSSDRAQPCRADAAVLRHIDVAALRAIFQGMPQNPLQGLEGRAAVLSRLGQLLQALPGAGGAAARPSELVTVLKDPPAAASGVQAGALLADLARKAAALWPAPLVQGLPAGDVWQHLWAGATVGAGVGTDVGTDTTAAPPRQGSAASGRETNDSGGSDRVTSGWVPLLAMPQALVAALALPLAHAGQPLLGLQVLSACADQPTSALLVAAGVVVPRHPRLLTRSLKPGDEAVIECRALTVALFDELAARVRTALQPAWGEAAAQLPVAQVVQAAAAVLAGSGAPALRLEGDGALL